jgi:Zn-dependent peptidase ImmA (M78 family)
METTNRPDYRKVKRVVADILEEYGFEHPPVNPVSIARDKGIDINFARFGGNFGDVSGFYDPSENAIYVNEQDPPLRQTFTIAHELAHALLHAEWASGDNYKVFRRDTPENPDDPREKEANAFAAHLLVPRHMLDQYYADLPASDLSKLFAVSVLTIKNRLEFEYGL